MAGEWFLAREGQQQPVGPLTATQLKQMAVAGQVQSADLVWRQGMPKWAAAGQIKGLLDGAEPGAGAEVPAGARVLDWRTQEPPRAEGAVAEGKPSFSEEVEEDLSFAQPEPWYYGFLEKYSLVGMWLGILVCVLGFVAAAVFVAALLRTGASLTLVSFALVFGVLVLVLLVLAVLFQVALILLAVDAARNLRRLRRK